MNITSMGYNELSCQWTSVFFWAMQKIFSDWWDLVNFSWATNLCFPSPQFSSLNWKLTFFFWRWYFNPKWKIYILIARCNFIMLSSIHRYWTLLFWYSPQANRETSWVDRYRVYASLEFVVLTSVPDTILICTFYGCPC